MRKKEYSDCHFCLQTFSRRKIQHHSNICGGLIDKSSNGSHFTIIDWFATPHITSFYYTLLSTLLKGSVLTFLFKFPYEEPQQYFDRLKKILEYDNNDSCRMNENFVLCQDTEINSSDLTNLLQLAVYLQKRNAVFSDGTYEKKENINTILNDLNSTFKINWLSRFSNKAQYYQILLLSNLPRFEKVVKPLFTERRHQSHPERMSLCLYCNRFFTYKGISQHQKSFCEFSYTRCFSKRKISTFIALFSIGDDCLQQSKTFANAFCMLNKGRNDFFISTFIFEKNQYISDINDWLKHHFIFTIFHVIENQKQTSCVNLVVYMFVQSPMIDEPLNVGCDAKNYIIRMKANETNHINKFLLSENIFGVIFGFYHSFSFFSNLDWMLGLTTSQKEQETFHRDQNDGISSNKDEFMDEMLLINNKLYNTLQKPRKKKNS